MASAGSNCPLDELLGEGSNSENNPVNPEICYNDEFAAQEEEDRRSGGGRGRPDHDEAKWIGVRRGFFLLIP